MKDNSTRLIFLKFFLPILIAVLFLMGSASNVLARDLTMKIEGASDEIEGLRLHKGINYFEPGDLLSLSVTNSSKIPGDLYAKLTWFDNDLNAHILWFVFDDDEDFSLITLTQDKHELGQLKPKSTLYMWNFFVPEANVISHPIVFTAYLWDTNEDKLIGMDSKTVFLNPEPFSP